MCWQPPFNLHLSCESSPPCPGCSSSPPSQPFLSPLPCFTHPACPALSLVERHHHFRMCHEKLDKFSDWQQTGDAALSKTCCTCTGQKRRKSTWARNNIWCHGLVLITWLPQRERGHSKHSKWNIIANHKILIRAKNPLQHWVPLKHRCSSPWLYYSFLISASNLLLSPWQHF